MSDEMKPSAALHIVRRASAGGYFDDLAREKSYPDKVRELIADLIGAEYADRIGFYRRGAAGTKGNFFRFWLRQSWSVT